MQVTKKIQIYFLALFFKACLRAQECIGKNKAKLGHEGKK